jgi:hypothetical protein
MFHYVYSNLVHRFREIHANQTKSSIGSLSVVFARRKNTEPTPHGMRHEPNQKIDNPHRGMLYTQAFSIFYATGNSELFKIQNKTLQVTELEIGPNTQP